MSRRPVEGPKVQARAHHFSSPMHSLRRRRKPRREMMKWISRRLHNFQAKMCKPIWRRSWEATSPWLCPENRWRRSELQRKPMIHGPAPSAGTASGSLSATSVVISACPAREDRMPDAAKYIRYRSYGSLTQTLACDSIKHQDEFLNLGLGPLEIVPQRPSFHIYKDPQSGESAIPRQIHL